MAIEDFASQLLQNILRTSIDEGISREEAFTNDTFLVLQDNQEAYDPLPAYYRGEMDSNLLAEQWAAEALRITIAWNEKLPAVMKIKQSPRSKLEISYNYIQQPRVTSSRSNTHIVATTEYWSYSNPSARTQICDTRDYVYTVIEANGKFTVTDVTSKLIDKKCK